MSDQPDPKDEIIDRLTQHVDVLMQRIQQLVDVRNYDHVRLSFTYCDKSGNPHRYAFEASRPALNQDPDIRDALAKGRAILETVHADLRNQVDA